MIKVVNNMPKDINQFILDKFKHKSYIKAAEIIKATGFSREYINRFFKDLVKSGKVRLIGKANQAHYVLSNTKTKFTPTTRLVTRRKLINKNLNEDVILREIEKTSNIISNLSSNIQQILNYSFTEMLNNAIDHSKSKQIDIVIIRDTKSLRFEIIDHGVGIFNNIKQKRKLQSTLEAIQDLLKGKQTTAPKRHSGEGIFFTSKVADTLTIQSSGKKVIFNNHIGDVFIHDIKNKKGTKVIFFINLKSKNNLQRVFKNYSGEAYGFAKTKVRVKLFELSTEYVARSQARRILTGLEKFKNITLDFNGVETVGQGFADEVFRVWQANHPRIKIDVKNATNNVMFMIKRARS